MKRATGAAATAAALLGILALAAPAWAENDYEHAKGLIDLRDGQKYLWVEMAERLIGKMKEKDPSGAALATAYLHRVRAEQATDLAKQREYFEKALADIDAFRKIPGASREMAAEAVTQELAIRGAAVRVWEAIARDPATPEDLRKALRARIEESRKGTFDKLEKAMGDAEKDYAKALEQERKDQLKDDAAAQKARLVKAAAYEKYVRASQQYFNELLRNAENQDPGSEEQKRTGALIVAKVTEWVKKQMETYREPVSEMLGVEMFMNLALGRGKIYAGDLKGGCEELQKVIEVDITAFEGELARNYAVGVQSRAIYFMAKALADAAHTQEDWNKALNAIGNIFVAASTRDKMLVIESRILWARCKAKLGRFEEAMTDLNKAVEESEELERKQLPGAGLRAKALQEMVWIIRKAQEAGKRFVVSPEVLVQVGLVSYRQGNHAEAVNSFREAVAAARNLDWPKRLPLEGEPRAWYLMGNSYYRLNLFLEAQLAYEGALLAFWGEDGRAIPEAVRAKSPALLDPLRRLLVECAANGQRAARAEQTNNPRAKFNSERLDRWLDWQVILDPDAKNNIEWLKAMARYGECRTAAEEVRQLDRERREGLAAQKRADVLKRFEDLEKRFLNLPAECRFQEDGIHYAGMCCYEAMSLTDFRGQTADDRQKGDDLGRRALERFDSYRKWLAGHLTQDPEVKARRARNLAVIDLTRPFILIALKKYDEALQAAEELRKHERDLQGNQVEGLHLILFKCYVELALNQDDLKVLKDRLANAEKEAAWFKEQFDKAQKATAACKAKLEKAPGEKAKAELDQAQAEEDRWKQSYTGCVGRLVASYAKSTEKAQAKQEWDLWEHFRRRRADLLESLLQLENPDKVPIDKLFQLAKSFFDMGEYEKARIYHQKLLGRFDPEGKHVGVPDDKLIGFEKLMDAVRGEDFRTIEDMKAGRAQLEVIKLVFLGDKNGAGKDYSRAIGLIIGFLDGYKHYGLDAEGKPGEARKGLEGIKEELELRLKLLKASNEITTCYVKLGEQLSKENNKSEESAAAFEEGLKNAKVANAYWPRDPDIALNYAICLLASGINAGDKGKDKITDALKILQELRQDPGSEMWWTATKCLVEGYINLKEYEKARNVLVPILEFYDKNTLEPNWPEINEVVQDLAYNKMKMAATPAAAVEKFLGPKAKLPALSYRPKSDLEKAIEPYIRGNIPDYVKQKKLSEADGKLAVELLEELVKLQKEGKLKPAQLPLDEVIGQIARGYLKSLQSLGGESRGEANDKLSPAAKSEEKP